MSQWSPRPVAHLPIRPREEESLSFLTLLDTEAPLLLSSSPRSPSLLPLLSLGSGFWPTAGLVSALGSQAARRSRTWARSATRGLGSFYQEEPSSPSTRWPRVAPSTSSSRRSEVIWQGAERERWRSTRWGAARAHKEGD